MSSNKSVVNVLIAMYCMVVPLNLRPATTVSLVKESGRIGSAAVGIVGAATLYYGIIKPIYTLYTLKKQIGTTSRLGWLSGYKSQYALSPQAEAELKAFWAKIGPVTSELARGAWQSDGKGGFRLWKNNPLLTPQQKNLSLVSEDELYLAAMFAGFKHVSHAGNLSQKFSSNEVWQEILRFYDVAQVAYLDRYGCRETLLYTPTGRLSALLLIQESNTGWTDCIDRGLLYGYPVEDIYAFRLRAGLPYLGERAVPSIEEITKLNDESARFLEQSRKLIAERSATIEQWISDNTKSRTIKFS